MVKQVLELHGGAQGAEEDLAEAVTITGRRAHPALVEAADLVTEMTKVKHQMDRGQKGQRGVEW